METSKLKMEKLKDLIKGVRVAMLTTLNGDGTLHTRPMWTHQLEADGAFWFFTRKDAAKIHEIRDDSHVTLNFVDDEDRRFVAVYGRGEVVRDRTIAEKLWNPIYEAWFPKGLADPDLALIRVRVERVEYWDSPVSKPMQLTGFVKRLTAA